MTPSSDLTKAVIQHYFEDVPVKFTDAGKSDEALFQILCDHVAWMMEHRMDQLLSLLYRLDVLEIKINAVLTPDYPEPPHIALAKLILDRQAERLATREKFKQENPSTKPDNPDAW
jgi:hypothetical protein